jgi:hypothetical protein
MKTVIYKGYVCNVVRTWDGGYYDLETVEPTEKLIIEVFFSVHRSELIEEGNNL